MDFPLQAYTSDEFQSQIWVKKNTILIKNMHVQGLIRALLTIIEVRCFLQLTKAAKNSF